MSTAFCVLRADPEVLEPDFLNFAVQVDSFTEKVAALETGASYPAVRDSDVLRQEIPLPPSSRRGELMTNGDVFSRFEWQDKGGLVWTVRFTERQTGFSGFMASRQAPGTGLIHITTHDIIARKQSMALLNDVRVNSHTENRGLASMLVREAIGECVRRGHTGIYGYLSDVDAGHFSKLKYFYEKLGFSVVFCDVRHPDYTFDRAGKIEMVFDNIRDES